ncbi:hypothetical protein [Paraburkholderia steynii]|uniref:hypothetical protein n=1 Tax=Paraburkholderia steynii TaxID=1245441 RepID=UPI00115FD350|nr:hypothetical protein [Paraburkholderia steynii]
MRIARSKYQFAFRFHSIKGAVHSSRLQFTTSRKSAYVRFLQLLTCAEDIRTAGNFSQGMNNVRRRRNSAFKTDNGEGEYGPLAARAPSDMGLRGSDPVRGNVEEISQVSQKCGTSEFGNARS